jgi:multisubunit Na+/H+ antiporter MnhB subunit
LIFKGLIIGACSYSGADPPSKNKTGFLAPGTMLEHWRRDKTVQILIYVAVGIFVVLLGLNIYGTYTAYAYPSDCHGFSLNVDERKFTLFFIYVTWWVGGIVF